MKDGKQYKPKSTGCVRNNAYQIGFDVVQCREEHKVKSCEECTDPDSPIIK